MTYNLIDLPNVRDSPCQPFFIHSNGQVHAQVCGEGKGAPAGPGDEKLTSHSDHGSKCSAIFHIRF